MIKLSRDYTIKFEPMNIILVKTGIKGAKAKNPGEKAEKTVGYFNDFEYLIEKLLNDKIIEFNSNSIQELIEEIKSFKKEVLETLEKYNVWQSNIWKDK